MREPYFLWINKKPPVTAERKTISQGHLINICINITLLKKCLHCVALAKVDLTGLEPTTSSMPSKRSTN